jgi:hypothetical protein
VGGAVEAGSVAEARLAILEEACGAKQSLMLEFTRSARIQDCITRGALPADHCRGRYADYGQPVADAGAQRGLYGDLPECRAAKSLRGHLERFESR